MPKSHSQRTKIFGIISKIVSVDRDKKEDQPRVREISLDLRLPGRYCDTVEDMRETIFKN
jgi:hypothetical protein